MTTPPERSNVHTHHDVMIAAFIFFTESGYLDRDGYTTPLGDQYIDALKREGALKLTEPPLPPPPPISPNYPEGGASGGLNWSNAHSDF